MSLSLSAMQVLVVVGLGDLLVVVVSSSLGVLGWLLSVVDGCEVLVQNVGLRKKLELL